MVLKACNFAGLSGIRFRKDKMAYSKSGDGYVGANETYAGRTANGTVIITSDAYSVTALHSSSPDYGYAPTAATITLNDNTTDVTVENDGSAGPDATINVDVDNAYGSGHLEILDRATLTSINEGYSAASGLLVGGYSNVKIGHGADYFGKAPVDGVGSAFIASGAAARDNGSYGNALVTRAADRIHAIELSEVELDTADRGFVINGVSGGDSSGYSVSGAGDVNGDGLDDLIVGAHSDDPNGNSSGASFVVFGKADGTATAVELSDIESGSGGFVINGVSANNHSGFSVSGAGDVNGDGFDDLIVGAPYDDPNGSASGASFVVFGKTDGTAVELSDIEAGSGGFVINGVSWGDRSGFSVSGAGDVNGDGLDDLIVGAHSDDPNGNSSGASFVVFGKADGTALCRLRQDGRDGGGTLGHRGRQWRLRDQRGLGRGPLRLLGQRRRGRERRRARRPDHRGFYRQSQREPVRRQLCRLRQDRRDGGGTLRYRNRQRRLRDQRRLGL
jgi:hypothetical protein